MIIAASFHQRAAAAHETREAIGVSERHALAKRFTYDVTELVFGWEAVDLIDDQDFEGDLSTDELEAELLLDGGEKIRERRWTVGADAVGKRIAEAKIVGPR